MVLGTHISLSIAFESLRGEGCDGQVLRPSEDCLAGCCGEGNVDVSKAVRRRRCSVAKLAAYLSKYISKGFEECEGGDSYRASGKSLPPPLIVRSSYTQLGRCD